MPIIRDYQIIEQIQVFDSHLNQDLSTYDAKHLNELKMGESHHFWFKTRRSKIASIFKKFVPQNSSVLEIGGGTGYVAEELKRLGFNVAMSDIHRDGLLYAKEKGIEKLYQFDLFNPPFEEEFDVICLFDVLEHLHDDKEALKSLMRMLKKGGKIILTVPAHQWLWSRDDQIAGHKKRYTIREMQKMFSKVDLKPVYLHYFFMMILPFLFLRKLLKPSSSQEKGGIDFKIHPVLNTICFALTQCEFFCQALLPNIAGGSILAVVQKE